MKIWKFKKKIIILYIVLFVISIFDVLVDPVLDDTVTFTPADIFLLFGTFVAIFYPILNTLVKRDMLELMTSLNRKETYFMRAFYFFMPVIFGVSITGISFALGSVDNAMQRLTETAFCLIAMGITTLLRNFSKSLIILYSIVYIPFGVTVGMVIGYLSEEEHAITHPIIIGFMIVSSITYIIYYIYMRLTKRKVSYC